MRTLRASIAIAATILVCALIASGCSDNPLESASNDLSKQYVVNSGEIRKGVNHMNFQFMLEPGEKKALNIAEFDQVGLIAFTSVQMDVTDPRVPIQQVDHCGSIDVYVDYKGDYKTGQCAAVGFTATEIVFTSKADLAVSISAEVGTLKDF